MLARHCRMTVNRVIDEVAASHSPQYLHVPRAHTNIADVPGAFMLPYTSQRRRQTSRTRTAATRISLTRFMSAARQWDVETVLVGLRAHPEFAAATDRQGRTALHLTATADARRARRPVSASVAVARALLDNGADIDAVHPISDDGEVF